MTLESDAFTQEKFAVYKNYQTVVHGESPSSISERGFRRFLCDSPVRSRTGADGVKLGSYHHCYRLDGALVAIGVLDLLPHAVSAVYFMYHESVQKHQPGKLGALREIALAQECGYRYWYPGYYIHSCPKMRYKIDYSPQYVLDPETLGWDLLDKDALAVLDRQPYMSMSRERAKKEKGKDAAGGENGTSLVDGDVQTGSVQDESAGKARDTDTEQNDDDDDDDDLSLFTSNMPGIASLDELEATDLDHIRVISDQTPDFFLTGETVIWSDSIRTFGSLKSKIAELAACLGTDLLPQIALDFRRASRARAN